MKIYRLFLSSLLILTITSCAQRGDKEQAEPRADETNSEVHVGSVDTDGLDTVEEFDQFIQKFSSEKSFQLNRIKFPIQAIVPDTEHEGMAPMEESIGKYDWEMLDLTYDSTYLTRPYDQYYQVVRFRNDTAVVEIRGINNGIYADYYFELVDNQWFLVSLYEASF